VTAEEAGWLVLYIARTRADRRRYRFPRGYPDRAARPAGDAPVAAAGHRDGRLLRPAHVVWSVWIAPATIQALQDLITPRPKLPARRAYPREPASLSARMEDYSRWASLASRPAPKSRFQNGVARGFQPSVPLALALA
jgi:hypothetical protein